MIVGDDTHDTVGRMVDFFQTVPQKGFTLNFTVALIEMALYRVGPGDAPTVLMQPRIVARTREVVRAVIQLHGVSPGVRVTEAVSAAGARPVSPAGEDRPTPTRSSWLEQLSKHIGPDVAASAEQALVDAVARGLEVDYKIGGPCLKWTDESSGKSFNFGQLKSDGTLGSTGRLSWRCIPLSVPRNIWGDYYDALLKLIPRSTRCPDRDKNVGDFERVSGADGADPDLLSLLKHQKEWLDAIVRAVERLRSVPANRKE